MPEFYKLLQVFLKLFGLLDFLLQSKCQIFNFPLS